MPKTHFLQKLRPLSVAVFLLGASGVVGAQEFSQMVFFGDSLTDTGRLKNIIDNSVASALLPTTYNSFTTNPDNTWAGVLVSAYGHQASANTSANPNGTNYAVGGAKADTTETQFSVLTIASVSSQIDSYLGTTNQTADAKALYSVWVGANDLLGAASSADATSVIQTAASAQVASIEKLHQAGARYILVPSLPDVGLTPRSISSAQASATASTGAKLYNNTLFGQLNGRNINVIAANTFALLQEAIGQKEAFGFENVTDVACNNATSAISSLACTTENLVTTNANETYAFADGIHPSGRTHRILAQYYQSLLDSPAQIGKLSQYVSQNAKASTRQLNRRLDSLDKHEHSVWAEGSISNQKLDGKNKAGEPNIMLGLDVAGQNHHTGAYLQYQKQDYSLSSTVSADVAQVGAGLYHRHDFNRVRLKASVGADQLDTHSDRRIAWDGANRTHHAKATGRRVHANIQGSYGIDVGKATYRPYVGVLVQEVRLGELIEDQGSLSTALNFEMPTQKSVQGEIGLALDYALNDKTTLSAGAGYQHEFKDDEQMVYTTVASLKEYSQAFAMPVNFTKQHSATAHVGAKFALGAYHLNAGLNASHQNSKTTVGGFVGVQAAF